MVGLAQTFIHILTAYHCKTYGSTTKSKTNNSQVPKYHTEHSLSSYLICCADTQLLFAPYFVFAKQNKKLHTKIHSTQPHETRYISQRCTSSQTKSRKYAHPHRVHLPQQKSLTIIISAPERIRVLIGLACDFAGCYPRHATHTFTHTHT
jgi:hypothetical protein